MPLASAPPQRDPLIWCAALALGFLALVWHRLGIPSKIYFDEIHYVEAARKLLLLQRHNPEHPMVGKELIAGAIWLWGDRPLVWRVPSALLGGFGLFAFGRLMWWASLRRFATLAAMLLLATSFAWFIQSRIAMLDMAMATFGVTALWQFTAALRTHSRWRLALCGVLMGLSLGAKWSVAPVIVLPGLTFLAVRLWHERGRFLWATRSPPVRGVSLIEAALWLGLVPLAVYWASFLPVFFLHDHPISPWLPIAHHEYMIQLQDSVRKPHPYASHWWQWIGNVRGIWYLYEVVDGTQRGIVLIGNPFTMLAGLAAWLWCLWAAAARRRTDALAFALLYAATIGLWIVTDKPVQFYYHYLLPGTFLMGCLALALDALWRRRDRWRWLSPAALALAGALFVWFYPIISAATLHHGKKSYVGWMWLRSWR